MTRRWRRPLVAIAISLAVNALVLKELDVSWLSKPPAPPPQRDVALAPLTASEWEANRAVERDAQRQQPSLPPVRPAPPPPPPRQMPGQVVDVAPSKDETPPKDSQFVSDRNNTVEKETRSKQARAGYENTLPAPAEKGRKSPGTDAKDGASRQASRKPAGAAGRGEASRRPSPGDAARDRLALVPRGELRNPLTLPPSPSRSGSAGPTPGEGLEPPGDAGKGEPLAHLRPGAAAYDKLAGGPSPDHLQGVEEGEGTYLNTREWKYAGYFNRIKQSVASKWDPGASMASRDPTGARFGDKDWQTLLQVKLDAEGSLKDVAVAKASGLDFLDRLAVDAFQKAQPFTNPPAGLADDRGEIVFTFGFYVQMSGSGLRIFRGPW
jgi:TonB family protein